MSSGHYPPGCTEADVNEHAPEGAPEDERPALWRCWVVNADGERYCAANGDRKDLYGLGVDPESAYADAQRVAREEVDYLDIRWPYGLEASLDVEYQCAFCAAAGTEDDCAGTTADDLPVCPQCTQRDAACEVLEEVTRAAV